MTKINNPTDNVSTTARQWLMLSLIERGRWVGTKHIHEQLKLANYDVSLRTVQRDLVALSKKFLLEKNNANPQGWRWRDDAPLQSMPNMSLSQAVAFNMVQANLAHLLPPTILIELSPWFDLANKQLKNNNSMTSWLEKVHIEPATQSLIAPNFDKSIKDDIYQSVFEQKQINIEYTPRSSNTAKSYLLNPLAIVQRGAVIYLLATKIDTDLITTEVVITNDRLNDKQDKQIDIEDVDIEDAGNNRYNKWANLVEDVKRDSVVGTRFYQENTEQNIRFFALHRCQSVTLLDPDAIIPLDFELKSYVETGAMGFHESRFDVFPDRGHNTKVTLVFEKVSGSSLTESKLSDDQLLTIDEYGNIVVTATVNLTRQLVWWLRGFGKGLISISPTLLEQVVFEN